MRGKSSLLLSIGLFFVFGFLWLSCIDRAPRLFQGVEDRVVISAPVQILLAGGDRFLAADFEAIRLAATGDVALNVSRDGTAYRLRAHRVVAELNACHEDNYYVGNALLSWGGAPDEGSELLQKAMDCRFWDEYVPFFYGFNELYFQKNRREARRAFEVAAERSRENGATYRRIAIMIATEEFSDDSMALAYLRRERDSSSDSRLREMLDKRVGRLEGLLVLKRAQQEYESATGRGLVNPEQLLTSGVIQAYPEDPTGMGYAFENGRFELHKLRIEGVEGRR